MAQQDTANATWPAHPSFDERTAAGKAQRETTSLDALGTFDCAGDRRPALDILTDQDTTRLPFLVPVRHARMVQTPFTFYRGAAAVMAADLASGCARSGLDAQICGDAHVSNFGLYASPERELVFDVNDFDETLRGPFEWDVKRLVASLFVAARNNRIPDDDARAMVRQAAAKYREWMRTFSRMDTLTTWYQKVTIEEIRAAITKQQRKVLDRIAAKAKTKDNLQVLGKLTETVDGRTRIIDQPPLILRLEELQEEFGVTDYLTRVREVYLQYLSTVRDDVKLLLDGYDYVDSALKVVGVGSVGSRAFIMMLRGRTEDDVLFLQVKQAGASVLEPYLGASPYSHHGQRVVAGQRIMQSASDICLGWATARDGSDYYWRQLKDWKGSAVIEEMAPEGLAAYGQLCAAILAKSHARSGDPVAIAAYLGKKDTFDRAMEQFAVAYADRNDADYALFKEAADQGKIEVSATF